MTAALGLLVAYAWDQVFGEPPDRFHPVAWIGRLIARGRDWALRAGPAGQLVRGAVVALLVPTLCAALASLAVRAAGGSPVLTLAATVLLLKPTFAVRALRDAAFAVRRALAAEDLEAARYALRSLCSRSGAGLDAPALIAATVESVAENTSDSVIAPLFFYACFGLPGAVFYRSVNTLDAMIGYHGRFEYAGKAAARLDDLLNLVPARLTAMLLLFAGLLTGAELRRGVAVLRRDGGRTESPNAGRPMAAMAGLLHVRLEKHGHYVLGDAGAELRPVHIDAAWKLASVASVLAVGAAAACAGALRG